MYSILLNSENKGYSFDSFYQEFIEICHAHKNEDKALAFAFILYDFQDAHINKIINDQEYWLSLNAISGRYLTVFSIHYKPELNRRKTNFNNNRTIGFMTSVSYFNNPSDNSNLLLKKYFGANITIKYPAVMFFQIQNNEILDYTLVELEQERIEESFLELKNYISKAVDVLKGISKEYRNNTGEIFSLVRDEVRGERTKIQIKKGIKKLTSAAELGATIVGLS